MADYTITAAQVTKDSGQAKTGTAGEPLTAGQAIYLKSTDNRIWKADANGTAEEQICLGITLHGASAGQPIDYLDEQGAVLTLATSALTGFAYDAVILSGAAAGGLAPHADLASGWRANVLGYLDSTKTKIKMSITRADGVRGA